MQRIGRLLLALLVATVGAGVLAGCSSSDDAAPTTSAATDPTTTTADDTAATCDQGATLDPLEVAPVDGIDSDATLTSFDGTEIRLHWFPVEGASADAPAPTLLMGPGWSLPGDTTTDGGALFSALSIAGMWDHGYNVLTWDPRGFGQSEGTASVNDPDLEGRDVQGLLDFVAAQPEAELDRADDPRVGMVGFSYGGGIQLTAASIDCRIDAIVPGLAWHSLRTSLYKSGIVKAGWSGVLTSTAEITGTLDPHITSAAADGEATGTISDEDQAWFDSRGPGDAVADISVPTLFVSGTVDTLFTLDETLTNYDLLREAGVPTAMVWFCGGHGTCLTEAGDPDRVADASFAWLDRYLRGDTSAPELPGLDLVDQEGTRWTAPAWPIETGEPIEATGSGTLDLAADGGAGPAVIPGTDDLLAGVVAGILPGPAERAVDVPIDVGDVDGVVVGAPELTIAYSGTVDDGPEPTRVFAQLVDDATGVVLGTQITPIEVVLDGESHEATVDLEVVAHRVRPGQTLTLQLVATTPAYATPRLGGQVAFDRIEVALPVAADGALAEG